MKRRAASVVSGAAPDITQRRLDVSYFASVSCGRFVMRIIIVGTILQPIAVAANLDPVHFAMIGIVSLAFGLVTPPYGLCLMICCSMGGMRMSEVLKDVIIMLLPMIGVLSLVIMWPQIVLFIPGLISPEFLR